MVLIARARWLLLLAAVPVLPGRPVLAQEAGLVQGTVVSAETGRPLSGVTVVELGSTGRAAVTGSAGRFEIAVPGSTIRLVAVRLGYAVDTMEVHVPAAGVTFRLREAPLTLSPLAVTARRSFSTASSETIRDLDLELRGRGSPQQLLQVVPGLVIAQHAGGGKAEQIFLRGFDADHGTDVALSVDGSPVNMVSHGHGQGYADLHFLPPEVVERVEVRKGPYDVRDGDLATAGAVTFHTRDRVRAPFGAARFGSFRTGQLLGIAPFGGDATRPGGYLLLSGLGSRGPFEAPQDTRRLNLFGKFTAPLSHDAEALVSISGFSSRWNASGQIPERAVSSGSIGRFGAIDPTEGGNTGRYDLNLGLRSREGGTDTWEVRAYAARYHFQLFSNFTFFLNDSINGDGIEQTDDRYLGGFYGSYERFNSLAGLPGRWSAGAGTRTDLTNVELAHQRLRERLEPWVVVGIAQSNAFSFLQQELDLSDRLRLQLGVRGDLFRFEVEDELQRAAGGPGMAGSAWTGIVSPKLNLAYELTSKTSAYANAGTGFHSNDARDVLSARHTQRVLPRAIGGELGLRTTGLRGTLGVAVWRLDLESELVYVGDEGRTEANGPTRRIGVDVEGRAQLASWLWADMDVNLARGRYRELPAGENHIPLAPTITATGGLTAHERGPAAGGIRFRYLASRAANEDASVTARGSSVWELFASYRRGILRAFVTVDNVLGIEWNEAQFATESRLRGEPGPVSELHFTPGTPRSVRIGLEINP